MNEQNETVRLAVYRHFASTGEALSPERASEVTGLPVAEVSTSYGELVRERHLVLDADGAIELAHPFAGRNFGFSVMGVRTLWWGGCAWDAFAIPHLVDAEPSVLVATTCPACGTAHAWTVTREAPPDGPQVAHFLTPTAHIWDDVVHACENQRIFCDDGCVGDWLAATGNERGSVFDLATLWRLAAGWYAGRLSTPYRRREPVEAAEYFRSVGLSGPFWGL